MRIYSNFKDYYDIGLAYHDDSIVYERYTEEVEDIEFPEVLKDIVRYGWKKQYREKRIHVYVICIEVFYVLSYSKYVNSSVGPMEHHIFSNLNDFIESVNEVLSYSGSWFWKEKGRQIPESVNLLKQLQFKYRTPIVHATFGFELGIGQAHRIKTNSRLSEVEFQKVIDPYQMYQKIETFLANDLAQELNPPVKIEDKYKIPAHGFDKWSFRKKGKNSI